MAAKTEVHKQPDGTVRAKVIGKIDEHFDAREILQAAAGAMKVSLQLDGVRSISSLGVRQLEAFLRELGTKKVVLEEISAALANQFSMIPNLLGSAEVKSAKLPFVCASCGTEQLHTIPYQAGAALSHAPTCGSCNRPMEFDGFSEEYLPHSK
jgi:anti-anti-sigma regulatory factor